MSLVPVDLPPPTVMRGRWAAVAAVLAALDLGRGAFAEPGRRWHYDDGGGNWCDLHLVDGTVEGRVVLVGHDHEYSDTYFREAAAYFGEPETDLLAGAPEWWAGPAGATGVEGEWIGFVYGREGRDAGWWRAPYDLDDGFASLAPPFVDGGRCRAHVLDHVEQAIGPAPGGPGAVDALVAADGAITSALLGAVVDVDDDGLAAGVDAALAFRL